MIGHVINEFMVKRIIMVGAFPPPVHGMAAVNQAVHRKLIAGGATPEVIDIAANSLDRSMFERLKRLPNVIRGLGQLLFSVRLRNVPFYMSVSGGFGQIYEVFFSWLARLRGMRLFLHHHSFAYLDKPSYVTRLLTFVAGSGSTHITLSRLMAERLKSQYPSVVRICPISNSVFFAEGGLLSRHIRSKLKTIGFISNISEEKGIFDFLDLAAACESKGIMLKAKMAGPFQDAETEERVRKRLCDLRTVEYIGPQYGDQKNSFFETIDALIFPTKYVNEAEPLAIHEAMQWALPVIAYGRGCIPEIIDPGGGLVIDTSLPFVPAALAQIELWMGHPDLYSAASYSARERFALAFETNECRWNELLRDILFGFHSSVASN